MEKEIKGLVIHCSDSTFGSATLIKDWHVKDNGWSDIGYTAVICNGQVENNTYMEFMNGSIEWGRDIDREGAHTRGFNEYESVCLIGKSGEFTLPQLESLKKVITHLVNHHNLPISKIFAHGDLDKNKEHCPGINVKEFVWACVDGLPLDKFVGKGIKQ